mgnify:CR=1 FL=1
MKICKKTHYFLNKNEIFCETFENRKFKREKQTLWVVFSYERKKNDFLLYNRNYKDKIYNKYDESKVEINNAFNFIKTLNPKPSGGLEDLEITEFLIPDFIIKKNNLVVSQHFPAKGNSHVQISFSQISA